MLRSELEPWQEEIVAASFLIGSKLEPQLIEREGQLCVSARRVLSMLPCEVAKEICIEILLRREKERGDTRTIASGKI
ncbi:MAG: hypothetical protein J5J00_04255 [Deltaproteobacteria bacterium]|nr:hypothetical protein [Deltaproteobacteria bacterium]